MLVSWTKAVELFPTAIAAAAITNFGTMRPSIAQTRTLRLIIRNGVFTMSDSTGSDNRGDALWDGERWIWMLEVPRNKSWFEICDSVPDWARHTPFRRI